MASIATAAAAVLPASSLPCSQGNRYTRTGSGSDHIHFDEPSFTELHTLPKHPAARRHSISTVSTSGAIEQPYSTPHSSHHHQQHGSTEHRDQQADGLHGTTHLDHTAGRGASATATSQPASEPNGQQPPCQNSSSDASDEASRPVTTSSSSSTTTSLANLRSPRRVGSCRRPLSELLTRAPSLYDTPMESQEMDEYTMPDGWPQPEKRRRLEGSAAAEPSSSCTSSGRAAALSARSASLLATRMMSVEMTDAEPLAIHQQIMGSRRRTRRKGVCSLCNRW
ncbi:hypothetical protein SYNPS1DRAFT_31282 [Syncephalis pseudoplumigaleata]|uniref:Uncharacterized protein n=1 Tax=Syncephalis pseudoplumigaleata TaxID=1712513 RepID=A0A4P9YUE3_9FUNG|nr:hypothetical protein SYNPS1DRAFT_31282 [Syncephalis pseudoplumigaleata]|eukprot:RKP23022.1 hypothetical protein SYNPS1DRAFT_31282 [Syncephalis pseudoplumigaleata]